jgi:tripartite-type tricarboxylate transporter receptor subunit TctC
MNKMRAPARLYRALPQTGILENKQMNCIKLTEGNAMLAMRKWLGPALGVLCLTGALLVPSAAPAAERYPARPVRFISGFPAGGAVDITCRVMADWLSGDLGQQFVVENRGGMGGNIGVQAMLAAPADGYTIILVAPNNAISASLYKKLPFDFLRDTVPVAGVMRLTNIMVVPPSLPIATVAEFIALAKARPGELSFASSGNGTSVHLSGELFKAMTGIDIVHVPYRGSAGAYPDLMTAKVHVLFDNLPGSIELVRGGQLRALGVTAGGRWPSVPDVPAIAETVPGYEASVWYGISAQRGTPPEVVDILSRSVAAGLANPKVQAKLGDLGGVPMPMPADEFGKFIAAETEKWAKVVRFANISVE